MGSYFVPSANYFFKDIYASGNVTANIFVGNGALLSGVTSTLPAITDIDIIGNVTAPGNITVAGQVNVVGNVSANYFIGNGALLTGVTATLPTIVPADIRGNLIGSYANVSNIIAVQGNVGNTRFLGGNVAVSGQINSLGNIVAPFFVGNGSQLTGITATLPSIITADIRGNLIGVYANVANIIAVEGNVGNTRFLGGNVAVSGQINALGNVVATNIIGSGTVIATTGNIGNVRMDTGVVTAPRHTIDGNYYLSLSGSNPIVNLDAFDYLGYNRTSNSLFLVVGGNTKATIDGEGNLLLTGNVNAVDGNFSGNVRAITGNIGNTRFLGGNVAVSGQINALGNVVAPFFIGNGSQLTGIVANTLPGVITADIRGNLIGSYANVANIIAVQGNVGNTRFLGGNVAVSGQVNVLGNVVAPFFIGNGSQLTGVTATLPTIVTADIRGNLIGVYANVANVVTEKITTATGELRVEANTTYFTGDRIDIATSDIMEVVTTNQIYLATSTVDVRGSDAVYIAGNLVNLTANSIWLEGNVLVSGQVDALGNVVAPFFIGNGSQLTGVTSTLPGTANIDIIGNLIGVFANVSNIIAVQGNVGNTRFLGGNVAVSGQVNTLGNVVAPFFIGNGSQLTGVTSTLPGTANIDITGNLIGAYANVANIIAVQGNVGNTRFLGGNVAVSGQVNVLGNVVSSYFIGPYISNTLNGNVRIVGSNIAVSGQVNVLGNVVSSYFIGPYVSNTLNGNVRILGSNISLSGQVTALGNVAAPFFVGENRGNLIGVYANVANIIAVQGNVANIRMLGGNMAVSGQVNVLGNVVAPFFIGENRGNLIGVYANVSNIIAVEGNVGNTRFLGGNVAVSGQINVLGNVVAPFFIGNGSQLTGIVANTLPDVITADIRGNLIGSYANVANIIAVQGNVGNTRFLGGNMAVSGQINALGNVVAPFFIGNGSQLTGIVANTLPDVITADIRGNLIGVYANVANIIAVQGNVGNTRFLGGNVAVSGQINSLGNVVAPFFIGNGSQLTGITSTLPGTANIDIRGNQIGAYSNVDNTISNTALISSAGNGNVLTVQSTTLNTTGALIQGTSLRGAVNAYSLLRLDNAAGRVLDIDGSGAMTANCTVNSDMSLLRATFASYTGNVLTMSVPRIAGSNFNFINCLASDGATQPFVVSGRGDMVTSLITANSAINANMLTVESFNGGYSNVMIQAIVPRGSFDNYSFLNCRNSNGNLFVVDGRGSVYASTVVNANVLSLYSGSAIQTQPLIQATSVRAAINEYSFLRCDNAGGRMFDLNGAGDLTVAGNIYANTETLNSGANANVLTVRSTTLNTTGSLIQGTSLRGAVNTYSLLRLDNSAGRVLDIDGSGTITSNNTTDSDCFDIRATNAAFTSDAMNIQTTRAATNVFNFIKCTTSGGVTTPFSVNGRGDVNSGSILSNTAINANILTVQSEGSFSNVAIQAIVNRQSFAEYTFINCRNLNGNLFNISGRGEVFSSCPSNTDMMNVYSTSQTFTSSVMNMMSARAETSAYNFITLQAGNGATTPFTVNGKGDINTTGNILCGNQVSVTCVSNANVLTISSATTNFTNSLIQLTTSRQPLFNYSFLRCDNAVGRHLDVTGQGSIIANVFTNANLLVLTSTAGAMTNDMLRISQIGAAGGAQYAMISAKNASGNVFRVNGLGTVYGTGAYNTTGADYAEMFEWEDGNTLDEDRRGITVVLGTNGTIHMANPTDNPTDVIGVVSVNPSVVGDTKWNEWSGRYLRDKFGAKLSNTVYYIANVSNETDRVRCGINDNPPDGYEKITSSEWVQNPKFDPKTPYISRENRPEWSPIGLMGKLRVLPGQIVNPGWKLLRTIKHADGDTLEYLVK